MVLSCLRADECFQACKGRAFVAGHPGHELKLLGWLSVYKPRVYVITDGSGKEGVSRLPSSARLLAPLGVEKDAIFGVISDGQLYRAILDQRTSWFLSIVDRLTDSFVKNSIDLVVADAMEGFNPAHDLSRVMVDAAVWAVTRKTGRTISNYKFCLTEWEYSRQERHDGACSHFMLDDHALSAKIGAAQEYAELKDEVNQALALRGKEYFRIECLKKVVEPFGEPDYSGRPDYEVWGEKRVKARIYEHVILYQRHVLPIINAIRSHISRSSSSTGKWKTAHHGR